MRIIPVMLAAALLAGCTTMSPEEQRAADEATCRSYGFSGRNDAFAECLQRIELDRRAERRATQVQMSMDPWPRERIIVVRPPRRSN